MTQKELLYITAIAETKSISKAAEKLFVAQPSLSYSLQRLEKDLGVELFKRTSEGLRPTLAGEYYIQTAQEILHSYRKMETKISWLNEMKVGHLVVGTTAFLGSVILPPIFQKFNSLYPCIKIEIVEDVSQNIEAGMLKGDIDIGIFHTPVNTNAIHCDILVREFFLLAVPPQDVLNEAGYIKKKSTRKYMDLRLTNQKDYILTTYAQRTRQRCNAIFSKAGVTPQIKYLTKSIQTATRMSGSGLGYTLVPESYSRLFNQEAMPNFYYIENEFSPYWDLAVCYTKLGGLSKPAKAMIQICNEILPCIYNTT